MIRLALAFVLFPLVAAAQERIVLPEGATTTVVEGEVGEGADESYVLDVKEGQTLDLTLTAPDQGTSFAIFPPGETTASFIGGQAGVLFSAVLPQTGDYTVVLSRPGATAPFTLDVAITNDTVTGAPVLPQ